ncbi:MAG: hypothetical protein R6X29_08950 [Acidimicrobiia bacterium]|jgi:L-fucose isomerase-like protein
MSFIYALVASPIHDPEVVDRLVAGPRGVLDRLGGTPGEPADLVLVATGGTERKILDAWEPRPGRPLVLVAHPDHNSLPAALEALARIHQQGGRGRIVYLAGDDGSAVGEALADLAVWDRLHDLRIGLLGEPSDWLVASSPDPGVVRSTWGPEVVPIELAEVYERFRPAEAPASDGLAAAELGKAVGLGAAIREIVARDRLDAVTLRCFDVIGDLDTTGCVALSDLNDAGVVAGCEGDLVSTVTMIWVTELVGEVPWMANPARVEPGGVLWLAHCTVPTGLVDRVRHDTHFESGRGVGLSGEFANGPVTLVRVGGAAMDRLWLAEGELVGRGHDPGLCRTQAAIRVGEAAVSELLAAPLGNHLVMVRGHHGNRLRAWWELAVAPTGRPRIEVSREGIPLTSCL